MFIIQIESNMEVTLKSLTLLVHTHHNRKQVKTVFPPIGNCSTQLLYCSLLGRVSVFLSRSTEETWKDW